MITPRKIQFANIPTPLEEIKFEGKSFLIKRDDLTGCELSGNKIRKLEYLLADAKRAGSIARPPKENVGEVHLSSP